MIQLIPSYKQKLKQHKPSVKKIKMWTEDGIDELKSCFDSTDWELFTSNTTLNEATVLISDYIDFCITTIIKEKEVKIYPNNKPWMSKEIKGLLKQKEQAARENDKQMKRTIQKEIDSLIRHGKQQFGKRIKNDFKAGNPKKSVEWT